MGDTGHCEIINTIGIIRYVVNDYYKNVWNSFSRFDNIAITVLVTLFVHVTTN